MTDRGRDRNHVLSEIRTVHSRAKTALAALVSHKDSNYAGWHDPDQDEMIVALEEVIEKLDRWKKTGAPAKCKGCGKSSALEPSHHPYNCPVNQNYRNNQ